MTSIPCSGVFIVNFEQLFHLALVFSFVDFVNSGQESVSYSIDTRRKLNEKISIIISIYYHNFEKIILDVGKFRIYNFLTKIRLESKKLSFNLFVDCN